MAKWIKFSDRMPTEADAGLDGEVFVQHEGGKFTADIFWVRNNPDHYEVHYWLENVPALPKPRTLEDVVGDLRRYFERGGVVGSKWCDDIVNEMREILERKEQK